jgi:hypothetical protein
MFREPTMTGLLRRARRGVRGHREDCGAALLLVLMLILVVAALSVLLLGMVLAQSRPTSQEKKSTRTVHAAEAGLNAALGQIRAATTDDSMGVAQGDRSKLPCGTITGTVGGESGNVGYTVDVRYYLTDPTNTSTTWRTANALGCAAGLGPSQVPSYALLEAQGTGDSAPGLSPSSGDRSLESVYSLQVTNVNVAGGLIHNMYGGQGVNLDLCFDAISTTPAANAPVKATTCSAGQLSQRFSYQSNYSIVLNSTQTTTTPAGMCVTYDATKATLVMRACDNTNSQKWGFDAGAHFRWPWSGGLCIKIQNDNISGSNLVADAGTCGSGYSRYQTWAPDPKVGAGNAGPNQSQLVNYLQFGRCFDDTGWDLNHAFMIVWPCKQDPTGGPGWNQQQTYDSATGHLVVDDTYCVTAPNTTGGYVTLTPCVVGQASQRWNETGNTGDYASSYTVVDYRGRCLGLGAPNAELPAWSTVVSAVCDGTLGQKWNAPPNLIDASNKNTRETTGQ